MKHKGLAPSDPAAGGRVEGNIIITFILLITLAVIVSVFLYMISGNLRQLIFQSDDEKALYTAEAGMQKAIWYLKTSTANGGKGESWRPAAPCGPN